MKAEITKALVDTLTASPAREQVVYDTREPGFVLRIRGSGVHSYAVVVGRGKWVTIGPQKTWAPDKARKEAKEIQQRVARGDPATAKAAAKGSVTLRQFLADVYDPWLLANRKRGARKSREIASAFSPLLDTLLGDITPFALERWRKGRLTGKNPVVPATCNRDLAELKSMFSYAVLWKHARTNPVKALKFAREDHGVVRFLSADEEQRLRGALWARDIEARSKRSTANAWRKTRGYDTLPELPFYVDYLEPLVLLALNTGLRRGEMLTLTWGNVDASGGRVTVLAAHAKSKQTRHVPLNAEARRVLTNWRPLTWAPDDLVFPGENHGGGDVRVIKDTKTAWGRVLIAAAIRQFRFHDLRHTFASKLVMRGIDLNTVRELLGHADIKMTLRYAHLAPEHLGAAVEKLVG